MIIIQYLNRNTIESCTQEQQEQWEQFTKRTMHHDPWTEVFRWKVSQFVSDFQRSLGNTFDRPKTSVELMVICRWNKTSSTLSRLSSTSYGKLGSALVWRHHLVTCIISHEWHLITIMASTCYTQRSVHLIAVWPVSAKHNVPLRSANWVQSSITDVQSTENRQSRLPVWPASARRSSKTATLEWQEESSLPQ